MEVTLDGSTKVVMADALRLDRRDGEPLDFARDSILIIDPATNRPVAICRPVPGAPKPVVSAPRPEPAAPPRVPSMTFQEFQRSAAPIPPPTPAVRVAPPPAVVPVPNKGPLTEGQLEQLQRLWRLNPGRTVGWVGAEFARQTGRVLAPQTVEKYRPDGEMPA